jgi:hypothetical protein
MQQIVDGPARVHALDAQALDAELDSILMASWDSLCGHVGVGISQRWQPELRALLRGTVWYLSMGVGCRTAGQAMQNLHATSALSSRSSRPILEPRIRSPRAGNLAVWQRALHGALVVRTACCCLAQGFRRARASLTHPTAMCAGASPMALGTHLAAPLRSRHTGGAPLAACNAPC